MTSFATQGCNTNYKQLDAANEEIAVLKNRECNYGGQLETEIADILKALNAEKEENALLREDSDTKSKKITELEQDA